MGISMVEPETFEFLTELVSNNRKVWIDEHREERDDALRNFTGMAITLHDYADRFDPFVADAGIKPKQSHTKLYQDPRHRSGPGLYHTSVDIFANAGHPEENFGYYLHIEPGNCHAGAGLFHPSKMAFAKIQKRLADDPNGLAELLAEAEFSQTFPDGLITRKPLGGLPEGISNDDATAPYLRMVGFGCRKDISDDALLDDDVIDELVEVFCAAKPLVRYFE